MSVTYHDSQWVVFPHVPDWSRQPELTREWEGDIATTEGGGEHRLAMRASPRFGLRFTVAPYNLRERSQMEDRLRAIASTGKALVPMWGRGSEIESIEGIRITTKTANAFYWQAGDYILLRKDGRENFDDWELCAIVAVDGTYIYLQDAPTGTFVDGDWLWPVILGSMSFDAAEVTNRRWSVVPVSVRELSPRAYVAPDLCAIYMAGSTLDGSGGDSFECYTSGEGPVASGYLNAGFAFSGGWLFFANATGLIARDDMESYSVSAISFGKGYGFSAAWVADENTAQIIARDDLESGTITGGSGFLSGWSADENTAQIIARDDFEGGTLSGGSGFDGSWAAA